MDSAFFSQFTVYSLLKMDVWKPWKRVNEHCHFDQVCDAMNAFGVCGSLAHHHIKSQPFSLYWKRANQHGSTPRSWNWLQNCPQNHCMKPPNRNTCTCSTFPSQLASFMLEFQGEGTDAQLSVKSLWPKQLFNVPVNWSWAQMWTSLNIIHVWSISTRKPLVAHSWLQAQLTVKILSLISQLSYLA